MNRERVEEADLPEICEECVNTGKIILNPDWPKGEEPYYNYCPCGAATEYWPDERLVKLDDGYVPVTMGYVRYEAGLRIRAIRYPDGTTSWVADARLIKPSLCECPSCKETKPFAPDDYVCWTCRHA